MDMRKRSLRVLRWLLVFVVVALAARQAPAQTQEMTPNTVTYPTPMKEWDTKMAFGVAFASMPEQIAFEGSVYRWPIFMLDFHLGLPENFTLQSTFSTEIVTNHLEADGKWQFKITDRLHANIAIGGAYFYGQLKGVTPLYDNTLHAWFVYPSASIGYDFGKLALTASGKLHYITSIVGTSGEFEGTQTKNLYDGFSYRLTLEQPFWKNTTFGLAFQLNYLKFYYPQWPLFATFNKFFWIPEAQVWFTL
jgi:hypothetical protein